MSGAPDPIDRRQFAARIAARSHMEDIRLMSTSAAVVSQAPSGSMLSYDLRTTPSVEYDDGGEFFVVRADYDLKIFRVDQDEIDEANGVSAVDCDDLRIANVQFEYAALYALKMRDGDAAPKSEELEAYANTTGQFALYPFARQYIHELTAKLGLPPLTLDVLLLPVEDR